MVVMEIKKVSSMEKDPGKCIICLDSTQAGPFATTKVDLREVFKRETRPVKLYVCYQCVCQLCQVFGVPTTEEYDILKNELEFTNTVLDRVSTERESLREQNSLLRDGAFEPVAAVEVPVKRAVGRPKKQLTNGDNS